MSAAGGTHVMGALLALSTPADPRDTHDSNEAVSASAVLGILGQLLSLCPHLQSLKVGEASLREPPRGPGCPQQRPPQAPDLAGLS